MDKSAPKPFTQKFGYVRTGKHLSTCLVPDADLRDWCFNVMLAHIAHLACGLAMMHFHKMGRGSNAMVSGAGRPPLHLKLGYFPPF